MSGALRGVIALDGPSGTGKTTVARKLARRLDAGYLDTGAMYRVVTLAVAQAGADPANPAEVAEVARRIALAVGTDPAAPTAALDGADVSALIRGEDINRAVSPVSSVPEVRELLVAKQRELVGGVLDRVGGIVVEGRDIGTVVVPDAPLKVYLTASAHVRASRRSAQDTAAGRESTVDAARGSVERRDRLDSTRVASPLRAAEDAVHLDTSDLTIDQVLVALSELACQRGMLGTGNTAKAGS